VLCSPAMINEYTQFFTPLQNDPALKRTITIGIEELKARATWRSRDEAAVTQWLTQYQSQNS
jgi:hypothetical protein